MYVQDLDMFVTVRLLDQTGAVLSLGKLCSEHGCSHEWKNGETPRLTKKWEDNYLYNGQLCTSCRTRIVIILLQQLGFYIRIEVPSMNAGNRCRQILKYFKLGRDGHSKEVQEP